MTTMKKVRLCGNSEVVVEEAERPQPGPGDVLIRTATSALCGSELHSYRGTGVASGNSGHEGVGTIAAVGAGVDESLIGKRVGVSAIAGCGDCDECRAGRYTWCDNFRFYGNMHAEFFIAAARACHPMPDDIGWDVAVLITGDGLGVPYHTSTKLRDEKIRNVAVFGLGPIGLGHTIVQTHLGRRVIGIDRSPERLELALKMGATDVVAAGEGVDVKARLRELTGGPGPDVCIEAAGVPATVRLCFSSVRRGGTVVFNGEQPALELSPSEDFIRRDITALGAWFYHFNEYPAMRDMYYAGLPVKSLITHRFSLEDAAEAYRAMADGKTGKVLLEYAGA